MRTGRPKQPLNLVLVDEEKLELLARRPKTARRVISNSQKTSSAPKTSSTNL